MSKKAVLINHVASSSDDIPQREGVPERSSFDGFRDPEVFMECMVFLLATPSLVLAEMTEKLLEKECPLGTPDSSWKQDFADDISLDAIRAQWYPLPFFGVLGSLISSQPKKGCPFCKIVPELLN